ncbi:MAG: hypothetical protein IJM18_01915 [Clostridia bacterium]|nr:hypothetical protein [Clostridia bacterium]
MKTTGIRRSFPALLIAALLFTLVCGCARQRGYQKTANTGGRADEYPYLVKTESATWYLAKADEESLGEDAFYEGLYALLDDAEADMRDAREALKGFIPDEIPPVDILTDFCGRDAMAETANAYYNGRGNFITLFNGWENARVTLLHEYVHYLTMHCAEAQARFGFWSEGIAEYIADLVCKNRLARSENMGFETAGYPPVMWDLAWDEAENCIDPVRLYFGLGAIAAGGGLIGVRYYAVMNETTVRTEAMQKDLQPQELSLCEAAGMIAYLVETYGRDTVFKNWNADPNAMETVYNKPFSELYRKWAEWNAAQCETMGIRF